MLRALVYLRSHDPNGPTDVPVGFASDREDAVATAVVHSHVTALAADEVA